MRQRPSAGHAGTGGFTPAYRSYRDDQVEKRLAFDISKLDHRMRVEDSAPVRLLGIIAALVIDLYRVVVVIMQRAGMVIESDGMQGADMTAIACMGMTGRSGSDAETCEGQRKAS